jgi:PII-like signaling protein
VREDQTRHGQSTYAAILDFLFFRGIAGATVIHGMAGFGADHRIHSNRLVDISQSLPIKIEFIETPETVEALMPKLYEMVGAGMIEVQETTVVKPARVSHAPAAAPARRVAGQAKLMRIFINEADRWGDKALSVALVEALRANDIAGVTVLAGMMGYGRSRRIYQEKMLELSSNRPMVLNVIDTEEKLRGFLPLLAKMVEDCLVLMSDVDVVKYTHDYLETERRQEARP